MKPKFELENPEIAEILGAFIGDGWIEKRGNTLYICGNPKEDKEYYDNFLAPLFSKHFIDVKPRYFPYWGVYGICTYRTKIIKKALSLGFHAGKKVKTVTIPDEIMNSKNPDVRKAVLRGIFDADGSFFGHKCCGKYDFFLTKIYPTVPRMYLGMSAKALINQISTILNELGIDHRVNVQEKRFRANRNHSTLYRLWITKLRCIERYFEIIGTSNPRLVSRYEVWKQLGYLPAYTSHSYRKAILEAIA